MIGFLDLFVHGIRQIDIWDEHDPLDPPPERPRMPYGARPVRPLPGRPTEHDALRACLTADQRHLLDVALACGALDRMHIREHWAPGCDPDCLPGWRLVAELLPDERPAWWDPEEDYDADEAVQLHAALCAAETWHDRALAEHYDIVQAIQTAPETDPTWAAYDAAVAAHPTRVAAYWARRTAEAQRITGFASKAEAEADYWRTHRFTRAHELLGYAGPVAATEEGAA